MARKKSCFTTKLLWRITTTHLRKLNEYKIQSIGFSRSLLKGLNCLDNIAQIMPQQKENVSHYKISTWRKQISSTNQFIRANKCVKIRISNSKEVKIMTTLLIGKQDGNDTKRAAGRPAAYFVFVVLIMAGFLKAILEFTVVAFFKSLTNGSE